MPLVTELPPVVRNGQKQRVAVRVDRHTLEKRRWRVEADDGTDIAVDLGHPCRNGDTVLETETSSYFIDQVREQVIKISIPEYSTQAARLGWILGNQHLPVELREGRILLAYDEQLLAKLQRLGISGEVGEDVFSPDPHSRGHHHH